MLAEVGDGERGRGPDLSMSIGGVFDKGGRVVKEGDGIGKVIGVGRNRGEDFRYGLKDMGEEVDGLEAVVKGESFLAEELRKEEKDLPNFVELKRREGEVILGIARDEEVGIEGLSELLNIDGMGMKGIELVGNGDEEGVGVLEFLRLGFLWPAARGAWGDSRCKID